MGGRVGAADLLPHSEEADEPSRGSGAGRNSTRCGDGNPGRHSRNDGGDPGLPGRWVVPPANRPPFRSGRDSARLRGNMAGPRGFPHRRPMRAGPRNLRGSGPAPLHAGCAHTRDSRLRPDALGAEVSIRSRVTVGADTRDIGTKSRLTLQRSVMETARVSWAPLARFAPEEAHREFVVAVAD